MDFISDEEYRQMQSQSRGNKINDLLLRVSRIEQALEVISKSIGVDISGILDPIDLDMIDLFGNQVGE